MRAKSKQLGPDDHRVVRDNVVIGSEVREITAPPSLKPFFHSKPPILWCRGDLTILNHTLLGIISARQIDSELASASSRLLKQLVFKDVSFVGGWHSPLEEEVLRLLLAQDALIVVCVSKALHRFIPSIEIDSRVSQGQALLLTHCSPKAKRITRDASVRRNALIVELAKSLLVLSAPEGSASFNLAQLALRQGKTVHTLDHPLNKELLTAGAVAASSDTIKEALRYA